MDLDTASDPALFVSDAKKNFYVFLLINFEGTYTSFFKDKKSEIKIFLTIFLLKYSKKNLDGRIRIRTSD
jgi:hypothetical protein